MEFECPPSTEVSKRLVELVLDPGIEIAESNPHTNKTESDGTAKPGNSKSEYVRIENSKRVSKFQSKKGIITSYHSDVVVDYCRSLSDLPLALTSEILNYLDPKELAYFICGSWFADMYRAVSLGATWMPQGEKRKKLEEEKGIIRFVIGHSFFISNFHALLLQDHVEGYLELSAKTKTYFTTAVNLWDADFYVKVDDDVHVNIATLGETLVRHRSKPRIYIGCMKSGPVLNQK
ncbi:hypothetical protein K1719_018590 [Acacia pycnantha]|nr:hypothetical protein K1719_018590 [Acacia pycnantha]